MAHTIEEMLRAKLEVSIEVARILAEFEKEYRVDICEVGYSSKRMYREASADPMIVYGKFDIEIRL